MSVKRLVALVLAVALVVQLAHPKPARADNTAAIVGLSIAAYAIFIGVCTYLIYHRSTPVSSTQLLPEPPPSRDDAGVSQVHLGRDCAPSGNSTVWLCW